MNKLKRYFGIALDPIHIGTGGYRLGGVDNTIVREPATGVPKIPGTSIAGVIRAFGEIVKGEDEKKTDQEKKFKEIKIEDVFGTEDKKGMLRFFDSQIIFFPVSSIQGTVWITTKELLEYWLSDVKDKNGEGLKIPNEIEDKAYAIKGIKPSKPLNLGWLLLEIKDIADGKEIVLPPKLNEFLKRIVIVSDKLFSHIVNDNLEERTSVRIDPTTGTAAEGALFTYEAIPRGTIFGFEVVIDTRKDDNTYIDQLIEATFPYLKLLGIGGLGTRGFGRMEVFTINDEQKAGGDSNAQS
jgi:CRISPR-associated protein Cmr4